MNQIPYPQYENFTQNEKQLDYSFREVKHDQAGPSYKLNMKDPESFKEIARYLLFL